MRLPSTSIGIALPLLLLMMCGGVVGRAQTAVLSPPNTRQLIGRFQMTGGLVGALTFSADGRVLAASSLCPERLDASGRRMKQQSVITLWEVASGRRIRSFYTDGEVNALLFTDRTASHLWSAGGTFEYFGEAILWNAHTGTVEAKYHLQPEFESFYCLAAAPDGSQVVVGSYHQILVLDGHTLKLKRRLPMANHGEDVHAVSYFPDGHALVATDEGSGPDSTRIWDARSGRLLRSLKGDGSKMVFVNRSNKYLLAFDNVIEFLDARTLRIVKELWKSSFGMLVFSPSQKLLFDGDRDYPSDDAQNPYAVRIWSLESGKLLAKFKGHTCHIWSAAFSSDERLLASGDQHGRINVWNLAPLINSTPAPKN